MAGSLTQNAEMCFLSTLSQFLTPFFLCLCEKSGISTHPKIVQAVVIGKRKHFLLALINV